MVTTGVVGSTMPIANGLAPAAQIRGEKRVTIAYFGDGASNIGAFHEALNMAAIWKLPVVFVCQNNGYAEHTKYELGTSAARVADRAARRTACPARGSTETIRWPCMRLRNELSTGRATGEGPRCMEADDISGSTARAP